MNGCWKWFRCLDRAFNFLNNLGCLFGFAHPIEGLDFSVHVNFKCHHTDGVQKRRKLPPLLYAIGVVTFEVDMDGKVQSFDWMRKPKQAPEVIQEIERTIKAAEPFPAPIHLGRVRYTETWLWHKSGKFQLDTLTEGQI